MSSRQGIYYWKCDRPAAFHGTSADRSTESPRLISQLTEAISRRFPDHRVSLRPAHGQGNHHTFFLQLDDETAFVRVEDGPEHDDYFDVEDLILRKIGELGIPAPKVLGADTSRKDVPFAWQIMECVSAPDLNHHYKEGKLPLEEMAEKIGSHVATWQRIKPAGYGPFDAESARSAQVLKGIHTTYESYFRLNLERHLDFLIDRDFLKSSHRKHILRLIKEHEHLLALEAGCLVHKDLALWNILGTPDNILAVIDWDDAISGDPMDDLSLLGCFYDGPVIERALKGYAGGLALPDDFARRFWLHLLRNILVKAVIRVGAGYFDRKSDFFLISSGSSGESLRDFTLRRLQQAIDGLESGNHPKEL